MLAAVHPRAFESLFRRWVVELWGERGPTRRRRRAFLRPTVACYCRVMMPRVVVLLLAVSLTASLGCGAASSSAPSSAPVALPTPPELASQAATDLTCTSVVIEALPNSMARVSGGLSLDARGAWVRP